MIVAAQVDVDHREQVGEMSGPISAGRWPVCSPGESEAGRTSADQLRCRVQVRLAMREVASTVEEVKRAERRKVGRKAIAAGDFSVNTSRHRTGRNAASLESLKATGIV